MDGYDRDLERGSQTFEGNNSLRPFLTSQMVSSTLMARCEAWEEDQPVAEEMEMENRTPWTQSCYLRTIL